MKVLKLISLGVVLSLVFSCGKEIIPDPEPTQLSVNVLDEKDELLYGVSVYLFDDEDSFNEARKTGNRSGRLKEGVTEDNEDDASLVFSNLNFNTDYYLFVSFRDRAQFLDLDNFSDHYIVPKDILYQSTDTKVTVKLSPAKSVVSFYTDSSPEEQFPIEVFIGNDRVGALSANSGSEPTPLNDNEALPYKMSSGNSWFARSSKGCFWAGSIQVDGTESYDPIQLEQCNAGAVTFWVDNANTNTLPIEVVLDGLDDVGEIKNPGEARDCFSENGLSVGRKPGIYTYTASSKVSACAWSGELVITEGSCEIIKLETCNQQ